MSSFWTQITNALMNLYNGIAGIITIVAAVAIAICTIGMMAAKNQKTVEEFKSWRTRVMQSWVVFFMLGIIVRFGKDLTAGMGLTSGDLHS